MELPAARSAEVDGIQISRPPTLLDVAQLAEVSVKTVSNVANGHAHVRDTTRRRVQRVIDQLGYRPNPIARALRCGGHASLTLIVPDRLRADSDAAVDQIVRLAAALGCHVVTDVAEVGPDELGLVIVTDGASPRA